jgi:hypothetical protein
LLDRLEKVCSITAPREHGLDTVDTIKAMLAGGVKVFVSMGGNFPGYAGYRGDVRGAA